MGSPSGTTNSSPRADVSGGKADVRGGDFNAAMKAQTQSAPSSSQERGVASTASETGDTIVSTGQESVDVGGTIYELGPDHRPNIVHDNGFLQNPVDPNDPVPLPTRQPTNDEIEFYNSERRRAAAGDFVSGIPGAGIFDDRAKLDDAIPAYRHFLEGGGSSRSFDYDKFLSGDESGRTVRDNALQDARSAGDQIYADLVDSGDVSPGDSVIFDVTSDAIGVGGVDGRYPYPATENWQKAIGGHTIWSSSEITVTQLDDGRMLASAEVTLHAEDRYNFNPNQADIATGEPDQVRGVLEQSGLAHQYDQTGISQLTTEWIIGEPANPDAVPSSGFFR